MKLFAKQRLLADEAEHQERKKRQDLDNKIQTHQDQIENLKKGLPSKFNKMKVSPEQQINTRKQINDIKDKILELRKQKLD